jgi:myo-inositol-1-phosphate synthase
MSSAPASSALFASLGRQVTVSAPGVTFSATHITARGSVASTSVRLLPDGAVEAAPASREYVFSTRRRAARTGVMVVGLCGNNGTTLAAGLVANRLGLEWRTRAGAQRASWLGSLTQAGALRLGTSAEGGGHARDVFVPVSSLLPLASPDDLVLGGWDISKMPLVEAVERAQVLDVDLQRQLAPHLRAAFGADAPLPSIFSKDFVAANQGARADNLLFAGGGTKAEHVAAIREQIRAFKLQHALETVIVLWSANTERFCAERAGLNDSVDALLAAIARDDAEVSPSTVFAVAAVSEGCSYINASPQNTFVRGLVELAERRNKESSPRVFLAGDDLKTGQTRLKTLLVEALVQAGIKPTAIASYNHLGNNDGANLSAEAQFKSKELSKSGVLDDTIASNGIVFPAGEAPPEHLVVIKYVKAVGDSKRAIDEYSSSIFLGGTQTITISNVCEDSLLAAPILLDAILLIELFQRVSVARADGGVDCGGLDTMLSLLSFLFKAPVVPEGAPVVNGFHRQRDALVNFLRALVGLPPDSSIDLEARLVAAAAAPKGGRGLEASPGVEQVVVVGAADTSTPAKGSV